MERFIRLSGRAAAMPAANIDTDVIMPKAFLKGIDRSGLAAGLFHDLRFDENGAVRDDFILNRADMAETRFLLVGPNFGCGSSREHAVWGMLQYGIRGIIGSSYGAIFADNAANNGLLLLSLPLEQVAALMAELGDGAGEMTVDLDAQRIAMGAYAAGFDIDPATRRALMLGLDRIGETLTHADRIRAFEKAYLGRKPWLMGAER
ncbi:3-isopropylmalate dehydratase [Sphingopyxis sp. H038]|uniref:3-isopropylmalate dehydratase small subunit n=1 Tax=unclassified Sphingopyxis TaxID=2614943 RepID=UPI0007319BB8|nr:MULTISPECIES: 3-isopropylmalate dehydratase small subunit [unclassified Sphingopyxis]KTE01100.1 3-isopropylmalate dehydratase [Sphingopyxis sp. H012]KTE12447.1 3-isopropylmalate dehydratase [Sphingopyxis sp. H053]KTE14149.1 3-isopropylmalate dehydratase [Sphingopyxis sp. H093]KTE21523.1 3-isopropylmalate dehydratase [Sphingopyxis sp. H080]KTE32505.1 3-isopropylmalate dehydratase [Sphingopyxis sp. H038]